MDRFKIQINLNTMGVRITYDNTITFLATIVLNHRYYDVVWDKTIYITPELFIRLKNKIIDTYKEHLYDLSVEE